MKTFKDIAFEIHPHAKDGLIGTVELPNGMTVSVVTQIKITDPYGGLYGRLNELTFEVAGITKDGDFIQTGPSEHETVLPYQTVDQVNNFIKTLEKTNHS